MVSRELQRVLALILTYGNYMNGGNMQRGQADGFTLEILPKLRDVKSKDNSSTFLHFIVAKYIEMYDTCRGTPEAKLPTPEPSDVLSASGLNFDDVSLDVKKLRADLGVCESTTDSVLNSSSEEELEPFKSKMSAFLEQANKNLAELEEKLEEGKRTFTTAMKFFDFVPKKGAELGDPSDFLQPWGPFCSDFKDIWVREQNKARKHLIEAKRTNFSGGGNLKVKAKVSGGLKDKMKKKMEETKALEEEEQKSKEPKSKKRLFF
jgi:ElaB/YqjD/DUF883 family membrane-anchored ribosome-binding protein